MLDSFYYVILLLAVCLHCASSMVSTVREGENPPDDCSYILRPEDVNKMAKCIDQAIIQQIIANITAATTEKMKELESKIPKLEASFTAKLQQLTKKVDQLEKIVGPSCRQCPRDCLDWRNKGFHTSGVYQVCPDNGLPFMVYCDMDTDGGGWVVFQHRDDGSTNFTQSWIAYKQGFGQLNGDFWLGFEKIHRFMKVPNKLRIDLVAYGNQKGYGQYNNFHIGNESTHYTLNVSDFVGNIRDQLNNANHRSSGVPFSTYDQDHDSDQQNCAKQQYNGVGYWYKHCEGSTLPYTMLNGRYHVYGGINGADANNARDGIYWYGWPVNHKTKGLIGTKMMFKRKY